MKKTNHGSINLVKILSPLKLKQKPLIWLFLAMLSLGTSRISANNIAVSGVTLTGRDISAGANNAANFTLVQFNVTWENSWRVPSGPSNWDAAWLFVKYRLTGGAWQHAFLNNTGHTAPSGSTIDVGLLTPGSAFNSTSNPGMVGFIYRSSNGAGTATYNNVRLRWNYGANGVGDNDVVDIRVYAVEMVYITQGSFSVGDGSSGLIAGNFRDAASNIPFAISGEGAITLGGTTAGNLGNNNSISMDSADDFSSSTTRTLPANFPKGFKAYYMMKYEISQQQYVDFLNTLTRAQQTNCVATDVASPKTAPGLSNRYVLAISTTVQNRNGVACDATIPANDPITFYCDLDGDGTGGETNDGQWLPCNFLSWNFTSSYLDWSGLRPMTELEYEKACRGNQTPVVDEYAWGSTTFTLITGISNSGQTNETITPTNANVNSIHATTGNPSTGIDGPVRVGVYATSTGTRVTSGAGYFGCMELSGSLWERTITVGNPGGRDYTGNHGDGALNASGYADQSSWPVNTYGSGRRGGQWTAHSRYWKVSDRLSSSSTAVCTCAWNGGRGVRTAP
jgi:formylglycine-generating enzyme required for sulfatase activity